MRERLRYVKHIPQTVAMRFSAHPVRTSIESFAAFNILSCAFYSGIDLTMQNSIQQAIVTGAEITGLTDGIIGMLTGIFLFGILTDTIGNKIENSLALRREKRRAIREVNRIFTGETEIPPSQHDEN